MTNDQASPTSDDESEHDSVPSDMSMESFIDASQYELSDLTQAEMSQWAIDPNLYLQGARTDPKKAITKKEYCKRMCAIGVSANVLALGKDPYPQLRVDVSSMPDIDGLQQPWDDTVPWFGHSTILRYITPSQLLDYGSINIDDSKDMPVSPQFKVDQVTARTASRDRTSVQYVGNHNNIHPIVRRSNFKETSPWEYEYLKPSLRILSKMLEMDSVLETFHALGRSMTPVPGTKKRPGNAYVYTPRQLSDQERADIVFELRQLSNFVYFEWRSGDDGLGETFELEQPGMRLGNITYVLTDGHAIRASRYNSEASDASSLLRNQFMFADLILHELGHAHWLNVISIKNNDRPFCRDDYISEEGHVVQAAVHSDYLITAPDFDIYVMSSSIYRAAVERRGVLATDVASTEIANVYVPTRPFGLKATRWPESQSAQHWETGSSYVKTGGNFDTHYVVSMEVYIRQFFTDTFWDEELPRWGCIALSSITALGVRRELPHYYLEYDPAEGPVPRKKRNSYDGLETDDLMPGTKEHTIVSRDWDIPLGPLQDFDG
ncbi:hypothetical protein E4T42_07699 [Aureobasidium subglaciale]|nr:hypothetical protein E4T42_07699 [Aureobasidium subglaciale]